MLFYLLIFLLITLFCLYKKEQNKNILFIFSCLLLFLIAAFRGNIDKDYDGYVRVFNQPSLLTYIRYEPTFLLITFLVKHIFNNVQFLFIIYALLGVSLNYYAIKKLSDFWLLSVLIYFSNFFILHEMTQIRAGVAAALILISIKPLFDRNLRDFLIITILASLFHYSAISALLLYFLNGRKIDILLFALLIPVSYLLYFLNIHITFIIELIPVPAINSKFQIYKYLSTVNNAYAGNVFNWLQISRCLLAFLFLWKCEILQHKNKYSILLIKIYFIAISVLVLLSDVPGIGARASELLMPVEIILIPSLIHIIKQKQLAITAIVLISLFFLCLNIFYSSILTSYF
jgi:hypothetical protein